MLGCVFRLHAVCVWMRVGVCVFVASLKVCHVIAQFVVVLLQI